MINCPLPCPTVVRLLLRYEPETGFLFWRKRPPFCSQRGTAKEGYQAFCSPARGYLKGSILGATVTAHRVIWAVVYGRWPVQIDHINGDKSDNRLCNLREASQAENMKNTAVRSDSETGYHGVCWRADRARWVARIGVNGRLQRLGSFRTKDEAISARKAAEARYGFHENHGRQPTT